MLSVLNLRSGGIKFVSCPTCGRTQIDLISIAAEVEEKLKGIDKDIFERLKRASYASSLRAFNSTEDVANDLMVHVFTGYDMLKYPELIASVTYDDVCARLESGFAENSFVLSTIYPKTKR